MDETRDRERGEWEGKIGQGEIREREKGKIRETGNV